MAACTLLIPLCQRRVSILHYGGLVRGLTPELRAALLGASSVVELGFSQWEMESIIFSADFHHFVREAGVKALICYGYDRSLHRMEDRPNREIPDDIERLIVYKAPAMEREFQAV